MPIRYDAQTDTLAITLGPELYESYELEAGDWSVVVDEADTLVSITISNYPWKKSRGRSRRA